MVLKSTINVTIELPKGLNLCLPRQYENIQETELAGCAKPELFKSIFFSL